MVNSDEWKREISMRKMDGGEELDASHVMQLIRHVEFQAGDMEGVTHLDGHETCVSKNKFSGEGIATEGERGREEDTFLYLAKAGQRER